jgi:hypothetical protein
VLVARDKAWNQWHTAQNVADRADIKTGLAAAACCVIHHWDSVALHNRVWRDVDRLEGAEEHQGQLHMTALFGFQPCGTHCAVKEKLGSGIPHESLSADVHVTFSIKLLRWIGVVRKWSNQAYTILLKKVI